jgi:APA family basic amino acid/polyamine antiporter
MLRISLRSGPFEAAASDRIASASVAAIVGTRAAKLVAISDTDFDLQCNQQHFTDFAESLLRDGQDGLFFRKLAEVHPRFGTPAFAIVVSRSGRLCWPASERFSNC